LWPVVTRLTYAMSQSIQADAVELIRVDLYGYLDQAEFLGVKYEEWSEQDTESARTLIANLVTVIRCLVAMHGEPADPETPRCVPCDTEWPCPALSTIHRLVKDPDTEFVRLVRAQHP
jgi:hypothetical protein